MKNFFILIALFMPSLAVAQDITQHYKIYGVKNGKITTIDAIINHLNSANVLFFGEEHNDSIGHYLETELFKKMAIT
ncbi:MAG: hypothetical protein H7202_06490, partial [Pedobacter sp.]|nr:hypothetical protein [Pedobacter sp.]